MTHQHTTQSKTSENDRASQASTKAKSAAPAMHPMLHLQRQVGNQAVGRLIQAKLTVGEPNDVYEQEADRVAAMVVSQIHAPQTVSTTQTASVQRQAIGNEGEELQTKPLIQRKSDLGGMAVSSEIESSIQQARGSGQPLADSIRTPMEQAFGADFSGVRVHTDERSDQLNRSIQARAFTTGQDVFFRQGEYSPGSRGGQELIAHELTHVMQQNGDAVLRSIQQRDSIAQHFEKKTRTVEIAAYHGQEPALQCKGRTDFPWLGVVKSTGAVFSYGAVVKNLNAATFVKVEKEEDNQYIVKVTIDNSEIEVKVPKNSIGEPLTTTIEDKLIGDKTKIEWSGPTSKHIKDVMWPTKCLEILKQTIAKNEDKELELKIGTKVTAYQSEPADKGKIWVMVNDTDELFQVERDAVLGNETSQLPSPAEKFGLMCYEYVGYAAVLAGVITEIEFKKMLLTKNDYDSGSEQWGSMLSGTKKEEKILIDNKDFSKDYSKKDWQNQMKLREGNIFQAGDIIILKSGDCGIHIALATGEGDGVYSLWHYPTTNPEVTSITQFIDYTPFVEKLNPTVVVIKPKWHDSFSNPLNQISQNKC
jgi:Domain of unknown function (DUF4157)